MALACPAGNVILPLRSCCTIQSPAYTDSVSRRLPQASSPPQDCTALQVWQAATQQCSNPACTKDAVCAHSRCRMHVVCLILQTHPLLYGGPGACINSWCTCNLPAAACCVWCHCCWRLHVFRSIHPACCGGGHTSQRSTAVQMHCAHTTSPFDSWHVTGVRLLLLFPVAPPLAASAWLPIALHSPAAASCSARVLPPAGQPCRQ